MARRLCVLAACMACLLSSPVFGEIRYGIHDLGAMGSQPYLTESRVNCINNHGQAAGLSRSGQPIGVKHAVLFDNPGCWDIVNLGASDGQGTSVAYGLNDNGLAVGEYREPYPTYDYRAVLFDPEAGTVLDLDNSGFLCKAYSINSHGRIVGFSYPDTPNVSSPIATLYEPGAANEKVLLGMLENGHRSIAYSINDKSQIVGLVDVSGADSPQAVLFDPNGGGNNISLGSGAAFDINNEGKAVGFADNSLRQAALFDTGPDGGTVNLGMLPGYLYSEAMAISDAGQIVGNAYYYEYSHRYSAPVLFDPTGGGANINLNDVVDPACGWTLVEATGVNNQGWIACTGYNSELVTHGLILVPLIQLDITMDGSLNLHDFAAALGEWEAANCSESNDWCNRADVNMDGTVDLLDLRILCEHWLEPWSSE